MMYQQTVQNPDLAFYPREMDRRSNQVTSQNNCKSHSSHTKEYDQYYLHQINPIQLLLFLVDLNFFTCLAALFTFAWDTITYAWVTTLIQPDQYHNNNSRYYYDTNPESHRRIRYQCQQCRNCQCQCQFKPVQNVFKEGSFRKTSKLRNTIVEDTDSSSWGQFVDVDLSDRTPRLRRSFIR